MCSIQFTPIFAGIVMDMENQYNLQRSPVVREFQPGTAKPLSPAMPLKEVSVCCLPELCSGLMTNR